MGIGKELAKLFAKDGYDLILVARHKDDLEAAANELKTDYAAHDSLLFPPICRSARARGGSTTK